MLGLASQLREALWNLRPVGKMRQAARLEGDGVEFRATLFREIPHDAGGVQEWREAWQYSSRMSSAEGGEVEGCWLISCRCAKCGRGRRN